MDTIHNYYEQLAATVISGLQKRQMEGYYCASSKEAVTKALSLLKDGSTVGFGGSITLSETGMLDSLRSHTAITLIDRDRASSPEEKNTLFHQALLSDYYFMSSNAVTAKGELVNIDGIGNRVAALIYGPANVILLVGMNKVVPTTEEAVSRAHNSAAPPNCIRLNRETPCAVTGICGDCLSKDCICSQLVITRRSTIKGRIKVILIGESLGY